MSRLDDPGFEQFVTAQLPRLLALAKVLTGNDHDAWDLVQDSLARVGSRWSKITNRGDPFWYARKTLINQNLNRLRRRNREALLPTLPDRGLPVEMTADGFEHAWLESALRRLSKRQRAAVVLAYFEDQSVAEIAALLGCSASAAKTHLARAERSYGRPHPLPSRPEARPGRQPAISKEVPNGEHVRRPVDHLRHACDRSNTRSTSRRRATDRDEG